MGKPPIKDTSGLTLSLGFPGKRMLLSGWYPFYEVLRWVPEQSRGASAAQPLVQGPNPGILGQGLGQG